MIVVIDYNVGNTKSVANALAHLGYREKLSKEPCDIEKASGIILPGVAAFGYAVKALGKTANIIKDAVKKGTPILGICVGYQMLFEKSSEMGQHKGLELVSGTVDHFKPGLTVPHMGWNNVQFQQGMELFDGMKEKEYFYFAHSYCANNIDNSVKVAYTDYGGKVPASVQKDNVFGVQFHPEKSGPAGLKVLRNFERICRKRAD